jgi:hypothetical protein
MEMEFYDMFTNNYLKRKNTWTIDVQWLCDMFCQVHLKLKGKLPDNCIDYVNKLSKTHKLKVVKRDEKYIVELQNMCFNIDKFEELELYPGCYEGKCEPGCDEGDCEPECDEDIQHKSLKKCLPSSIDGKIEKLYGIMKSNEKALGNVSPSDESSDTLSYYSSDYSGYKIDARHLYSNDSDCDGENSDSDGENDSDCK